MTASFGPFTTRISVLTGKVQGSAGHFFRCDGNSVTIVSHPNLDQKFELKMDVSVANRKKVGQLLVRL